MTPSPPGPSVATATEGRMDHGRDKAKSAALQRQRGEIAGHDQAVGIARANDDRSRLTNEHRSASACRHQQRPGDDVDARGRCRRQGGWRRGEADKS